MSTKDSEPKTSDDEKSIHFSKEFVKPTIFYKTSTVLVLDNVLTSEECTNIKNLAPPDSKKKVRKCLNMGSLTETIIDRCKDFIPQSVYDDNLDKSYKDKNYYYWNQPEINNNWRVVRYPPSYGGMKKHLDTSYVVSINDKSIFTIMIYLTDNDDGGTQFSNITIYPKIGRLIIFEQKLLHEGLPNKTEKCFVRSEIMYKRFKSINSKGDVEAFEVYQKALEENDTELEKKAFKQSTLLESMVYNY